MEKRDDSSRLTLVVAEYVDERGKKRPMYEMPCLGRSEYPTLTRG